MSTVSIATPSIQMSQIVSNKVESKVKLEESKEQAPCDTLAVLPGPAQRKYRAPDEESPITPFQRQD